MPEAPVADRRCSGSCSVPILPAAGNTSSYAKGVADKLSKTEGLNSWYNFEHRPLIPMLKLMNSF